MSSTDDEKSVYSDWSKIISSKMPNFNISVDNAQLYSNFMVLIAVMGSVPLAIQGYKVYSTKKTDGISLPAFIFQIFISSSWLMYGLVICNGVITISSILNIIAASFLVFFTWKHSRNNNKLNNNNKSVSKVFQMTTVDSIIL